MFFHKFMDFMNFHDFYWINGLHDFSCFWSILGSYGFAHFMDASMLWMNACIYGCIALCIYGCIYGCIDAMDLWMHLWMHWCYGFGPFLWCYGIAINSFIDGMRTAYAWGHQLINSFLRWICNSLFAAMRLSFRPVWGRFAGWMVPSPVEVLAL